MNNLLSIIIPTLNEEANLPYCIKSLLPLNAEIYVVDSNSTDKTRLIAESYGCNVVTGAWGNFAEKFNWAIDNLPISTPWVLRLDADEWVTDEFVLELKRALQDVGSEVSAFNVKRRVYFLGGWIKHGGMYPLWSIRVWRHGKAKFEMRELDEDMVVSGQVVKLRNDIVDENRRGLSYWVHKHNIYADNEIRELSSQRQQSDIQNSQLNNQKRRWVKDKLYYKMPIFLRPLLLWFARYIVLLGFLDGKPGLVYHFLHGFWYRFLIDAKLYEASLKHDE